MDFTGIIAEYDPFHNGHAAQLAAVRAAGAQCIAVCMSSGAVQRGGVPILPESVRVRAALDAGADLVVALPAPYACATAEQFAAAGVHLLAALGCDTLAFGAETPDAAALLDTARLLDGEELNARIRQNLATGMTYAAARCPAKRLSIRGTEPPQPSAPKRRRTRSSGKPPPVLRIKKPAAESAGHRSAPCGENNKLLNHYRYEKRPIG